MESGKKLSELEDAEMNGVPEDSRERLRDALREGGILESKVSAGGTSSASVEAQIAQARQSLTGLRG
jgi:argininosuccinate lyase